MAASLTYAVPDLHGRFDLLCLAVEKIATHANNKDATIVTLGDYVDRGPDSRSVIDHLMRWHSKNMRLASLAKS
jgi:serine/threonine protein phosphatase 1